MFHACAALSFCACARVFQYGATSCRPVWVTARIRTEMGNKPKSYEERGCYNQLRI